MDTRYIIIGLVMICVGILIVIVQIKWFKKGLKDQFGYQLRLLLGGFALIFGGVLVLMKSL